MTTPGGRTPGYVNNRTILEIGTYVFQANMAIRAAFKAEKGGDKQRRLFRKAERLMQIVAALCTIQTSMEFDDETAEE